MHGEHIPRDLVKVANIFYDRLAARKVDWIVISEPVTGYRLSNLARSYVQSHIWRCLNFVDSGYAEYLAGRLLTVYSCARSTYENVAVLCDFVEILGPLVDAADYQAAADLIHSRTAATRIRGFAENTDPYYAIHILKQIDRMDRRNPGYRAAFDHLSDTVHPNASGAVAYFCELQDDVATFGNGARDEGRAIISLVSATVTLGYAELAIQQLESTLRKLSERRK